MDGLARDFELAYDRGHTDSPEVLARFAVTETWEVLGG
jgi:hypothetical protein